MNEIILERKHEKFNQVVLDITAQFSRYDIHNSVKSLVITKDFRCYVFPAVELVTSYFIYNFLDELVQDVNYTITTRNPSQPENIDAKCKQIVLADCRWRGLRTEKGRLNNKI